MKIIQKISAAALAVLASCQLFGAPTGKSFYSMRPITSYPLFRPQLGHDKRSNHFMISATPLYHASANGNNFHRYFMPGGKDELLIAGARLGDVGQDLSAAWFNIAGDEDPAATDQYELYINSFKSRFTFKPSFRMYGASLYAQQSVRLGGLMLDLSAQLPVLEAQANTRVEEVIVGAAAKSMGLVGVFQINDVGGVLRAESPTQLHSLSLSQALSNRAFMPKGRLAPTRTVARGLGDLVLAAGADVVTRGSYTAHLNARVTVPTADKPTADYLFQPLLGNNGHWGVGVEWGNSLHFTPAESTALTVHQKISYDYFLPAHELRTFDLIGRPWSRYVQVTNDGFPYDAGVFTPLKTAGPATGAFTLKTSVTPREQLALSHACTGSLGRMSITAGHEWYYKRAEDLKLKGSLGEGRFIALSQFESAVGGQEETFAFGTNPNATVASHPYEWGGAAPAAPAGYQALANNLAITDKDLDLRSAQQPQYTAHTFFVQAQAHFDETSMLSIGGQYEFAVSKNRPDAYSVALTLNKRV